MTGYFGPAYVHTDYEHQVATPIGALCAWCGEVILFDDTGTVNGAGQASHYACGLRSIVGSVNHQKRLCRCFGGTLDDDPPGLSRRAAAIAAMHYFHGSKP